MKASVLHQYGGPDALVYEDFPDPAPAPDGVLIKVAAASVNPVDLLQRAGGTKEYLPVPFPGVIGWDVAGTVRGIGTDVTGFLVGDHVMAWGFATYAELCTVKASVVSKVPEGLALQDAAALPLATTTGSQLISVGSGLKAGQTILVSGALGSVARAAVRTAKDRGGIVIAGVRGSQVEEAGQLGADQVLALDDTAAMSQLAPVDIVANTVRGETADRVIAKVKKGGTFVSATGAPATAAEYPEVKVVSFVSRQNPATMDYMAAEVRAGRLLIPISRRMSLREAREAHELMQTGVSGKILLIP